MMNIIKLSKSRIEELLPTNVKDSCLSQNAKKVLAVMIEYFNVKRVVAESCFLAISNRILRECVGIKSEHVMEAIQELIETNLIERNVGKRWKKGEKPKASEYTLNWENICFNPIKKPTAEERLARFLKKDEPKEEPTQSQTVNVTVNNYISQPVEDGKSKEDLEYELAIAERDLQYEKDRLKMTTNKKDKEYAEYWVGVRGDRVKQLKHMLGIT